MIKIFLRLYLKWIGGWKESGESKYTGVPLNCTPIIICYDSKRFYDRLYVKIILDIMKIDYVFIDDPSNIMVDRLDTTTVVCTRNEIDDNYIIRQLRKSRKVYYLDIDYNIQEWKLVKLNNANLYGDVDHKPFHQTHLNMERSYLKYVPYMAIIYVISNILTNHTIWIYNIIEKVFWGHQLIQHSE